MEIRSIYKKGYHENMEDTEDLSTCYVCLEECEEESHCSCHATAHEKCLREFGKSKCTICLDKLSVCSSESRDSRGSRESVGSVNDSMASTGSHHSDVFLLFPMTGDGLHPAKCFAWAFMFIMTAYVCFGVNLRATILGGVVFLVFCLFGRFLYCLCRHR